MASLRHCCRTRGSIRRKRRPAPGSGSTGHARPFAGIKVETQLAGVSSRNFTSVVTTSCSSGLPRSTSRVRPEYTRCTFPERKRSMVSASSGPEGLPRTFPSTSTTVSRPRIQRGDSVLNNPRMASTFFRERRATSSGMELYAVWSSVMSGGMTLIGSFTFVRSSRLRGEPEASIIVSMLSECAPRAPRAPAPLLAATLRLTNGCPPSIVEKACECENCTFFFFGQLAQLDRAMASGAIGRQFESPLPSRAIISRRSPGSCWPGPWRRRVSV